MRENSITITLIITCLILTAILIFIFPDNQMIQTASTIDIVNKAMEKFSSNGLKSSYSYNDKNYPYLKNFLFEEKQSFISSKTDFLEINFPEMKAKIYKNGVVSKEIPILAKGKNSAWGGTPAGIYKVIAGYKSAFSNIAKVYMPWTLHFYGKYYLHGEPYYPNGKLLISEYSGGCIRFKNDNAETIWQETEIGMPVLIINKESDNHQYNSLKGRGKIVEISAQSYLIADLNNYFIFAEKNSQKPLPIASLTKLMTAVVTAENASLKRTIRVKERMLSAYGSTKGLTPGKNFKLIELLHPLLIESSNDAAEVLSYMLGKEKTINLMNEKTKLIGMQNTTYVDPSGLSEENTSTAEDLFYLADYISDIRPSFLKISKGEIITTFGSVDFNDLKNKNIFEKSEDFIGGKTGFILKSKYTGLFIFKMPISEQESRDIVIILLGSDDLEKDVGEVIKWWFNNNL